MVIRIIRKGNSHTEESVTPSVVGVKQVKIVKKVLSPRDQKLVSLVANGSKKAPAMIKVGYSPKTARAPSKVFNKPEVKDAVDSVVAKIESTRDKILEALSEKDFKKVNAFNLSMMMNMHNKDVELLSGRPTSREEYVLPEEEQQRLRELLDLNK